MLRTTMLLRMLIMIGIMMSMLGCARGYIFTFGNATDAIVDYDDLKFVETTVFGPEVSGPNNTSTQGPYYVTLSKALTVAWTTRNTRFSQDVPLAALGSSNHLIFIATEGDRLEVFFKKGELQPTITDLIAERKPPDKSVIME